MSSSSSSLFGNACNPRTRSSGCSHSQSSPRTEHRSPWSLKLELAQQPLPKPRQNTTLGENSPFSLAGRTPAHDQYAGPLDENRINVLGSVAQYLGWLKAAGAEWEERVCMSLVVGRHLCSTMSRPFCVGPPPSRHQILL